MNALDFRRVNEAGRGGRRQTAARVARALAGAVALWFAAGCSIPIPQAEKDPTRYYVLGAITAPAAPAGAAPIVHLRAVEVASYLGGRPIVVRRAGNEIEFREFARWGEPLDVGITRVLREELMARGAARAVNTTAVGREARAADATLSVRVMACEGETNGDVVFRAGWELVPKENGAVPHSGDFRAQGLRWDGRHEGSLASALSQAVAMLAGEIAGALKQ